MNIDNQTTRQRYNIILYSIADTIKQYAKKSRVDNYDSVRYNRDSTASGTPEPNNYIK